MANISANDGRLYDDEFGEITVFNELSTMFPTQIFSTVSAPSLLSSELHKFHFQLFP